MPRWILLIAGVVLVLAILGTVTTFMKTGATDNQSTQTAPAGAR